MAGTEDPTPPAPQSEQPQRRRRRRRRRGPKRTGGTGAAQGTARASGAGQPARTAGAVTKQAATGATPKAATTKKGSAASKRRRRPKKGPKSGKKPAIPTTREVSAGGVVYRRAEDGSIEVVLASRRTRRGQLAWGLAKGGIEEGESREQAAIREVREETGLTAVIEEDLGDTKYIYVWDDVRIRKTVHFFLMRHTGGDVEDRDDEMEEIRWFPLERAIKRAAYRGERDMLLKASELLR